VSTTDQAPENQLAELRSVGADFVSLGDGIDATTPAEKLQLHILAALAKFERAPLLFEFSGAKVVNNQ
jgi:hypothetical protein